jgi:GntR family transcriptional regulator, rspAB operon transcriptional repressor
MAALLRDSVYQAIRRAILTCELKPGQELREQILAEKYRVSRSPIRDSLLRLELEKLVTVLPRQGYRVNPIGLRDMEELFGLRLIIAPACAAEAARAEDAILRTLDQYRDLRAPGTDDMALLEYNRAFHCAVAELAGNTRMAAVEVALVEEFDRLILVSLQADHAARVPIMVTEHVAIIDALQSHDSDTARRLTYQHIAGGQRQIRTALGSGDKPDGTIIGEGMTARDSG